MGKKDLDNIDKSAFNGTFSVFYACNTATARESSFAQKWSQITGGVTKAASGQTEYTYINGTTTDKALGFFGLGKRGEWKSQRGSYDKPGASYRLPKLDWDAEFVEFTNGIITSGPPSPEPGPPPR